MTKNDIVESVSRKTKQSKSVCEETIDIFINEIKKSLIKGDRVVIKGFAVFETYERPEHKARNPKTGEIEKFSATKSVKCRISKAIKDIINGK